jgi:calcium-dependent protein kinase
MGICNSANDNKQDRRVEAKGSSNGTNNIVQKEQDNGEEVVRAAKKGGTIVDIKHSRINKVEDIGISSNNFISQKTGTPLDDYISDKKLGEGSYGAVFRVKNKDTGVYRAMKKFFISNKNDKSKEKELMNEIEMLKKLDHPNIVKVFESYDTKEGYYIITEYCKGGELFDKIMSEAPFEESACAYIMYQILSAVFYCHNLNIIHRDLKPENILIESEEKDSGYLNIKIIDFGTAKIFDKNKTEKSVIGSAYYIAPEVLNEKYNEKCDIWSCGVIMYILLSASPPFNGEDTEIISKIKVGKYDLKADPWPKVSSEAKDLIKQMLQMNVLSRISAQKALSHKWFKKFKMRERFTSVGAEKLKQICENVKKHKSSNKLQQAALAFLVHNSLHLPEIKDIIKVFKNIDTNGDGRITREELCVALSRIYNVADTEEDVEEIFRNVDNDNNGYIEYEELMRASVNKELVLTESNLKYSFKYFDVDGSGEINIDEIASVLFKDCDIHNAKDLTKKLMEEFDVDSDCRISFPEFKDMMVKLCKK